MGPKGGQAKNLANPARIEGAAWGGSNVGEKAGQAKRNQQTLPEVRVVHRGPAMWGKREARPKNQANPARGEGGAWGASNVGQEGGQAKKETRAWESRLTPFME